MKRLLLTPGEPAGIGPDIIIKAAQHHFDAELVVIADPTLLQQRAALINLPLKLIEANLETPATPHIPQQLKIIPVALNASAIPGILNPKNATYVMQTLESAASLCLKEKAHGLVTGPVHKAIMNEAGIPFTGHTEFLAQFCHSPKTIMIFVVNHIKVALLTTHLALKEVPSHITRDHVIQTVTFLNDALHSTFHIKEPRILVCGLNPHAGENGYLGREEIDVIIPALKICKKKGIKVEGPLPADTIFTPHVLTRGDVVLAMYHDQALPVVKNLGFHEAVNVTLGLPFIRTSVDHGTALEIAGSKEVKAESMFAAIKLAQKLSAPIGP